MKYLGLLLLAVLGACRGPKVTELVNITFTTSVDTSMWKTWDFDVDACVDSGDPRLDDARLREELFAALEVSLTERGYERGPDPDFLVSYKMSVTLNEGDVADRGEGRILLRDVRTGRAVWMGERKAPLVLATSEASYEGVKVFVEELIQFSEKLKLRLEDS